MGIFDIPICLIALILGFNFKNKFKVLNNYEKNLLDKLFIFHLLIGIVFYFYIQGRGDAFYYWMYPKEISFGELINYLSSRNQASDYIYLINFFFSNTLDLSFFTGSLLYCFLGYRALVYHLIILKKLVPNYNLLKKNKILNISVFPFFLFFPNLHFWSSGVGKDTLMFFCIALFVYSLFDLRNNIVNIILSILLSIFIRPHITMFLVVGFGVGYALSDELKTYKKFSMILIFAIGFSLMFDYVLNFIQLESLDIESIEKFSNIKSTALKSAANSGVDISGYPYILKILTYLYRPLFFDISNVLSIIASFENLFLLLLTLKIFKRKNLKHIRKSGIILKSIVVFLLIGTLTFSLILGNLGIMLREKNMFTPLFLITAYWLLSLSSFKINSQKNNSGI